MHKDNFRALHVALHAIEEEIKLACVIPSFSTETAKKIQDQKFFEMIAVDIENELVELEAAIHYRKEIIEKKLMKIKCEKMRAKVRASLFNHENNNVENSAIKAKERLEF